MHTLPPLSTGTLARLLPLAPHTAERLTEALLADSPAAACEALEAALRQDPAFCLWALMGEPADAAPRPDTCGALAQGLLARLPDCLATPAAEPAPPQLLETDENRQSCADLTVRSLCVALLAADRVPVERREQAYLAGLIHAADEWWETAADSEPGPGPVAARAYAPPALGPPADDLAAAVAYGVAVVEGRAAVAGTPGFDLAAVARRCETQARGWLTGPRGASASLGALARALARKQELETRFEERLLEEKMAALVEFTDGLGHEVNPVLTVISGRAQLILQDESDPERRRLLALIHGQALRIHEMIADAMQFAKPPPLRRQPFDLAALLRTLADDLADEALAKQVRLTVGGVPPTLSFEGDAAQMAVVVRALVQNAIRASSAGRAVELSLRTGSEPEAVELWVRDEGRGLSEEERRHLFDPFYSGYKAGRGLGLGLPKCWRIVARHGGRIEVESELGRGTCVRVWLPCEAEEHRSGRITAFIS